MSKRAEELAWKWATENKLDPYSMGRAYGEGYEQAEKDTIKLFRDEIERRIGENRVACISDFNDLISFLDELEKEKKLITKRRSDMKKIRVIDTGEIIELTVCRWEVRQGVLYNLNTKHDEGVEGDEVEYRIGDTKYRGHIVGYTCYQFITTKEWGQVVLSAMQYNPRFIHNVRVEMVE